ncbi:MAG TPA: hypothetical protein VF683_10455 [Chthoniobacterales bacterium]
MATISRAMSRKCSPRVTSSTPNSSGFGCRIRSEGNFVLMQLGERSGEICEQLRALGVLVRIAATSCRAVRG